MLREHFEAHNLYRVLKIYCTPSSFADNDESNSHLIALRRLIDHQNYSQIFLDEF